VCDDVVDVKALRSETIREKTKQVFRENLVNLLEPGGRAWLLFTPWHAADLNAELKSSSAYAHYRRAVGDDLEPVWPEKWPRERLAERRAEIGESSFARAFRLRTLAEEDCLIRAGWVQYWQGERPGVSPTWEWSRAGEGVASTSALRLDARQGSDEREDNSRFVVLAIDPAVSKKRTADASALVTLAKVGGKVCCLEAIARRVSAPELVQLIDDAERRWQPDVILFESNAAFKGIKDLIAAHARFGSKVKEIVHSSDKTARMHSFSVRVENGAFLLHGENGVVDPGQQELLDEMLAFPVGKHDDLVDAAAFGSAYLFDMREPRAF
jgi:predicted phage terminase large subunit-like protein